MNLVMCLLLIYVAQSSTEPDRRVITSLKYSKFRVKPTVVNGEPATTKQVPFLVSIKEPTTKNGIKVLWTNLCGGSIIKNHNIVTAAHCFEADRFHYAKRPYLLRAVAGTIHTDLEHTGASGVSQAGTQWRRLTGVVLHQHFNFPTNDIAIASVDYPWTFKAGYIRPVALASRSTDVLGDCTTAGYGRIGHRTKDETSKILLLAAIETMSRTQCSMLWEMNMDKFVCSRSARSDVSEGDSGSPLTCVHSADPAGRDGRDLLVGFVSGKNFDKTTLFTRVSEYRDWIDSPTSKATRICAPPIILIKLIVLLRF